MFTVTPSAQKVLKAAVQEEETDSDLLIRLKHSAEDPLRLEFELDTQQDNDTVFTDADGTEILIIESTLAEDLDTMILDFQGTGDEAGFSLTRAEPDA